MIGIKFLYLDYNDNLFFFVPKMSSTNDMNDNESTSTFSSEGANSNTQQNLAGRPFNPVWDHFNQVEKKKGGHYSANCKYCPQQWARGDIMTFKIHIAHNCSKAPSDVQLFYYKQLIENNEIQKSNKKQKVNPTNKEDILKYVENQELSSK